MIFLVLGTLITVFGLLLVRMGKKTGSREMFRGAIGMTIGGILLIFLALSLFVFGRMPS